MAKIESRLITKKMPWHANMTEMNHLGAALIAKPHVMEGIMTKIFTSQQYSDNALTSMLVKEARTETIDKSSWEWSLKGASTRPLVIMDRVEPDSNTTVGKYKVLFTLKFDENWWKPGDVIHPGASDKRYQCRVTEVPQRHGKGWLYKLVIMTDDTQLFIPTKFLSTGTQWAKLYSVYEEAAEQAGSTQYSGNISMENTLGRFRKSYSVTGDVANEVLAVSIPSKNGMVKSWIKYAEVEYWQQWYKELERADWYSRKTYSVTGANGRPVDTFPGIHEQLEDSHIHAYSTLTARLIEEYLMDIFYGRVKPGSARHVKGFTGEYGMLNFHRAIEKIDAGRGFLRVVDDKYITKTSSPYHDNALSYGYQYTMYKMANGSTLELVHNPLYDDREINMEIDELTGMPKESQRITFLDFGSDKANSNVKLMTKANEFKLGYVAGTHNPYGPNDGKLMAHTGDYYEMVVQDRKGVHIEDVTRCGELILDRN